VVLAGPLYGFLYSTSRRAFFSPLLRRSSPDFKSTRCLTHRLLRWNYDFRNRRIGRKIASKLASHRIKRSSTPLYLPLKGLFIDRSVRDVSDPLVVSVDVSNIGHTEGDEVARLYVHQQYGTQPATSTRTEGLQTDFLSSREKYVSHCQAYRK
jgi:hypothetical protein